MNEIIIHELPKLDDILTKQYFSNAVEIRANMTRLTGSGRLLVSSFIIGSNDPTVKKVEDLYNQFTDLPHVQGA